MIMYHRDSTSLRSRKYIRPLTMVQVFYHDANLEVKDLGFQFLSNCKAKVNLSVMKREILRKV